MLYNTRTHSFSGVSYGMLVVVVLGLAALAISQVADILDRPEVRVSHSTGQCVEVKDYKAEHEGLPSKWSCDNLPSSYERVWVE